MSRSVTKQPGVDTTSRSPGGAGSAPGPALLVIKGDATDEEVAALTAVLAAMAASAAAARYAEHRPRAEWSAPHRQVRRPLTSRPGGWRASSLPR